MKMRCRIAARLALPAALVSLCGAAEARELRVPDAYATIQAAIDAALDGDEIFVEAGVYAESILWNGKSIALVGEGGAVIDPSAGAGGRCMELIEVPSTARVEGITCRNGVAEVGGGALISGGAPVLRSCVFERNAATNGGGGVFVDGGSASIEGCAFVDNSTSVGGGGLHARDTIGLDVVDSSFRGNRSARGAGATLANGYHATVERCSFEGNDGGGLRSFESSIDVRGSVFRRNAGFGGMDLTWGAEVAAVEDCVFEENSGSFGGLFVRQNDAAVSRCAFIGNRATSYGGGVLFAEAGGSVSDSLFLGNDSEGPGGGAAFDVAGTIAMNGCAFVGNHAGGSGGGIAAWVGVDVNDCVFLGNRADVDAGAVDLQSYFSAPVMVNRSVFRANEAGNEAGGLRVSLFADGGAEITNSVFDRNEAATGGGLVVVGGGIFGPLPASLTHGTFYGNTRGAVAVRGAVEMSVLNSILWGSRGAEIDVERSASLTVMYSDVQGGFPGTGNIHANPLFVNTRLGDLRLRPNSPCRDAGIDTGSLPPTDLLGNPRIAGRAPDMGAYEIPSKPDDPTCAPLAASR